MAFQCTICTKTFTYKQNLQTHIHQVHNKQRKYQCNICGKSFQRNEQLKEHTLSHSAVRQLPTVRVPATKKKRTVPYESTIVVKHSSHLKNVVCLTLRVTASFADIWTLYKHTKADIKYVLLEHLQRLHMLKFDFIFKILFHKATDDNETITCYFHSKAHMLSHQRHTSNLVLEAFKALNKQVEDYLERGSGWVIKNIQEFNIHIVKYQPIKDATYTPLPPRLLNRKAVVNVKNKDNKCFMWSVLAALHPVQNNYYRTSHYETFTEELDFEGMNFPIQLEAIPIFEHFNSLSINVYAYNDDEDQVKVLQLSENNNAETRINLLLYNGQHYCWIKDIERFLNSETGSSDRQFQCHLCLCMLYSAEKRDMHMERCKNPDLETVEMPNDSSFKFSNHHKMLRQSYAIYADFECLLEKVYTCLPDASKSHTTPYQKHVPCGYGAAEVFGCCANKTKLGETHVYRGQNTVQLFLDKVIQWGERHQQHYDQQKNARMTKQDWQNYHAATMCNICKEVLAEKRVLDHCHFCGSYRGACHSNCNLQYRLSRDVVVVLHNLRRYDGHLILQRLGDVASQRKGVEIFVIPKGFDDYLTFSLRLRHNKCSWNLKFIDSYQFMSASFSRLVDNVRSKGEARFSHMSSYFTQQQLSNLLRKGIYPYDYMDGWNRFTEDQLPPIEQFHSTLTDESISHEDYHHAQHVWNVFNMQNLGDYHDLYLLTDVLLLADVFENFRTFCLDNYHLDPAHYFTAPSFSWDACLKMTGVELELLMEPDMYTFVESGIRGGISIITHRYAKANNPLVPDYNPAEPPSFIMYLDANNLYGWTMTCALPLKDFHWLSDEEVEKLDVTKVLDNNDEGYVLEVDLEYPEDLHQVHSDYPLAPERLQAPNSIIGYVEEESYGWFDALSDIGGSMGLCFGASVISIIEIPYYLISAYWRNRK